MNKRRMSLIGKLLNANTTLTIDDLARCYSVSVRTIRNDIAALNDILQVSGLTPITLSRGGVVLTADDFSEIYSLVSKEDYYDYKLSSEERVVIAAELMVKATGYITVSDIADKLYFSRATVIENLSDVKDLIKQNGMEVLSVSNKGHRVTGKESAKRMFLLSLDEHKRKHDTSRQKIVQDTEAEVLYKIVREQEHAYNAALDDASFWRLQSYLAIMLERCRQGIYIEALEPTSSQRYRLAQDIMKHVCQYCNVSITQHEIAYLARLLDSCRFFRRQTYNQDIIKVQMITRQFITGVSKELGEDLNGDYGFFEKLSSHLEAVLIQKNAYFPENDVIRQISEDEPEVHQVVRNNLDILTRFSNRVLSDIEINYITVHVCAALERLKNRKVQFRVAVVCHAGIGTSQLLVENLKKHFHFHIVGALSAHEAADLTEDDADFIISTVRLRQLQLDYVVVSAQLNDEDIIRVGAKATELRDTREFPQAEQKKLSAKGLLHKLKPSFEELDSDVACTLYERVEKIVREYFNETEADAAHASIFSPSLSDLLCPEHIRLDVECSSWQEAVRASGAILLEDGYIESRYIDAMVQNIYENGPYVVLSPGFAMPHEGFEMGSLKVGMSLIRLTHPIEFGDEEFDPVSLVCCLSATDHQTHLKAFFNLVNLLKDQGFKESLMHATTPKEAAYLIEAAERHLED